MPRKKIHRFLLSSPVPNGNIVTITDERVVHQVGRVLKMEPGEVLSVFSNGSGDTIGQIQSLDSESIIIEKSNELDPIKSVRTLITAISIPKGDTFELIVQKLTELGVNTIVPIISDRTIKQSVRIDRLQSISDEALEQSGGSTRVTIHERISLKESLIEFQMPSIAFEPGQSTPNTPPPSATLVMYVGPEGGWSEDDIGLLNQYGVMWQNLGSRILRTETAAIVGAFTLLSL